MASRSTLIGPYALGPPVGRGAVTRVYEARASPGAEPVALSVLEPVGAQATHEAVLSALERLRRLAHDVLVSPDDFGVDGGRPWAVSRLVRCRSLRDKIHSDGPLPAEEVIVLLRALAQALDHAHSADLVHGALRPDSVHLCPRGSCALRGFDLAWAYRHALAELGEEAAMVGNPLPLSPEQIRGEAVGPASDLYQLGLVAFEAVAGSHPFGGDPMRQVRAKLLTGLPSPNPLPHPFRGPVSRCLAPEPEDRWPTCRSFVDALPGPSEACRRW